MDEQTMIKSMIYRNSCMVIALCILCKVSVMAQVLNQDSKGESSILYPGGTAYFNATETQVGFAYNNLPSTIKDENGLLLGISLKGETKSGIFDFLKEGEIVPSSKISGFLGYYQNYNQSSSEKALRLVAASLANKYREHILSLHTDLISNFDSHIDGSALLDSKKKELQDKFKTLVGAMTLLNDLYKTKRSFQSSFAVVYAEEKNSSKTLLDNYINTANALFDKHYKPALIVAKQIDDNLNNIKKAKNRTLFGWSTYIAGGLEGTGYKYYDETLILNNSFASIKNESFALGEVILGGNLNVGGGWIFGLALGPGWSNNFDDLSSKEFTIEQQVMSTSSTSPDTTTKITRKESYKAYTKKPTSYLEFILKFDIAYFMATEKGNIVLNPYFRYSAPERNKNDDRVFPITSDLGFGLYFNNDKGKFQGGVYVQANDLNDNTSKIKGDESNLNFGERLSFGIVTKFSIGSIFQKLETAKS